MTAVAYRSRIELPFEPHSDVLLSYRARETSAGLRKSLPVRLPRDNDITGDHCHFTWYRWGDIGPCAAQHCAIIAFHASSRYIADACWTTLSYPISASYFFSLIFPILKNEEKKSSVKMLLLTKCVVSLYI